MSQLLTGDSPRPNLGAGVSNGQAAGDGNTSGYQGVWRTITDNG